MEEYKGNENFGPSHYDYDFDFECDLRFSVFDYFLVACYALFVMPFVFLFDMLSELLQQHDGRTKDHVIEMEGSESSRSELCAGPCCVWPETSHS